MCFVALCLSTATPDSCCLLDHPGAHSGNDVGMSQRCTLVALVVIVGLILCGSLYPFEYDRPSSGTGPLAALFELWSAWPPWGDFLANILFYAPLGVLGVLSMPASVSRAQRLVLMVLFASVLSVGNELMQFYLGRQTSIFDVGANVLGTFLGSIGVSCAVSNDGLFRTRSGEAKPKR